MENRLERLEEALFKIAKLETLQDFILHLDIGPSEQIGEQGDAATATPMLFSLGDVLQKKRNYFGFPE